MSLRGCTTSKPCKIYFFRKHSKYVRRGLNQRWPKSMQICVFTENSSTEWYLCERALSSIWTKSVSMTLRSRRTWREDKFITLRICIKWASFANMNFRSCIQHNASPHKQGWPLTISFPYFSMIKRCPYLSPYQLTLIINAQTETTVISKHTVAPLIRCPGIVFFTLLKLSYR